LKFDRGIFLGSVSGFSGSSKPRAGWRKSEPEKLSPEEPRWLRRSVYRAYSEEPIFEGEAERPIGESLGGDAPPTLQRRRSSMGYL
jgi:hypothetical protein